MTSIIVQPSSTTVPIHSPPPAKKGRRSIQSPSAHSCSPPRVSPKIYKEVLTYEKAVVDEFIAHLQSVIERTENETLYWATMYEEGQKETFELKEKLKLHVKDEADYIDPEAIPNTERRSSRPSIDNRAAFEEEMEMQRSASRLPQGWFTLKSAVKSAVSAVVGTTTQYP